jgi:hypothetical protein
MGAYLRPSLTTISSNPAGAGALVRNFFRLADGDPPPRGVTLLERALVKRAST